jgi:DNA-binding transcriptional MerR regulator
MEKKALPPIPAKRYFTIGEVSELCGVKPYVLRYWEQEFTQLKPMKRRGNRRYYQHHEVLLIRRIRELLYDQGFTISGARNQLAEKPSGESRGNGRVPGAAATRPHGDGDAAFAASPAASGGRGKAEPEAAAVAVVTPAALRLELQAIRALLGD